jgi:hypothetical protein
MTNVARAPNPSPPAPCPPQSYTGPRTRLRRVLAEMLTGKPIEIDVLGGSVSAGAIASRKMAAVDPNDVWSLVRIHLQTNASPKIAFYNNARSATKSYIASLCINRFLNSTADLVFVEFIANDGSEMDTQLQGALDKTRSFERFLRKIQGGPNSPAVVMMQVRARRRLRAPGRGPVRPSAPRPAPAAAGTPVPRPQAARLGISTSRRLPRPAPSPTPPPPPRTHPDAGERDGLPSRGHERQGQALLLLHARGQLWQPCPVLRHPYGVVPVSPDRSGDGCRVTAWAGHAMC